MNNAVRQLNVFVDYDDLFRCGGRINNVIVHYDTNFPYLMTVLKVSKENEDVSNNKEPFVF